MMRAAIAGFVLALAACSPEERSIPAPADTDLEAHPATPDGLVELPIGATAPLAIEGEWRVAGVDGQEIDIEWAMTASITTDQISIQSQCMGFGRMYALEGMALSMPEVPPATGPVPPPPPVCARMPLPEEQAVSKALQEAVRAYRMPDGALVLDGPETSLTFYTQ